MTADETAPRDPKSIDIYPTFLLGISTAWHNLGRLLVADLIVAVPTGALMVIGCPTILSLGMHVGPAPYPDIPVNEWIALGGCVVFGLGLWTWTYAAVFLMADAALAGKPMPGVREACGAALDRVPALLGAYLCVVSLSVVGSLFCMVPGIVAGIAFAFAPVRAVTRGSGPIQALWESFGLTRRRWWRIIGYFVLVSLCIQAIYLPIAVPLSLLSTVIGPLPVVMIVLLLALSTLLGVFQQVCLVALHRRLEQRGPAVAA